MIAASAAQEVLVSLDPQPWHWLVLGAITVLALGTDMALNRGHEVHTRRRIVVETAAWVALGVAFGGFVWAAFGGPAAGEYFSGYLIEKSLSVDNVFVWAVLLAQFGVPLRYQHKVLFWGIFGAVVLRAAFIFAGAALLDRIWWLVIPFGLLLGVTGVKVLRHRDDEGHTEDMLAMRLVGKFVPISDQLDGHRFFTRVNARRVATPLLAALVAVEFTDVIFAVDSVPAILAVSREEFIVFSSNIFAILGLRSLYFLLADAKEKLHYLSHALGAILLFVGAKMITSHWYHLPTAISLGTIAVMLVVAVVASLQRSRRLGPI
jgi:tellurite resistance protein TerC